MNGILYALLAGALAFELGNYEQGLFPGRLSGWENSWTPAPVVLSGVNAQMSGVKVTLYLKLSSGLDNGVLTVEIPNQFVVQGGSHIITFTGLTYEPEEEFVLETSSNITNPAAGVYGPIKAYTRDCTTCQIKDINSNLGRLIIAPAASNASTQLAVSIHEGGTAAQAINKTLRLDFNLSQNLRMYDTVIIRTSDYWSFTSPIACSSIVFQDRTLRFKGADVTDPTKLACTLIDGDVYIYGLSADIDISIDEFAKKITLLVTSLNAPQAARPAGDYVWGLEIVEFGTKKILQKGTANGPNVQSITLTQGYWELTWNQLTKEQILQGMQMYINIALSATMVVPANGYAEINTSFPLVVASIANKLEINNYCYLITNVEQASCTSVNQGVSGKVTINFPQGFSGSQDLKFTVLADFSTFNTNIKATAIIYDQSGIKIAEAGELFNEQFPASQGKKLINLVINPYEETDGTTQPVPSTGMMTPTYHLRWAFQTDTFKAAYFISTAQVKLFCPLADNESEDNSYKSFYLVYDADTQANWLTNADGEGLYVNPSNIGTFDITYGRSNGFIKFNIPNPATTTCSDDANGIDDETCWSNFIMSRRTAATRYPKAPFLATNIETRYQCALHITDPTSTLGYELVGTVPFQVSSIVWGTDSFARSLCLSIVDGMAVKIKLLPNKFQFPRSPSLLDRTYYLEFKYNADGSSANHFKSHFGSGLSDGERYPCSGSYVLGPRYYCEVKQDGSYAIILLQRFQKFTTTEPLELVISVGYPQSANSSISGTITGYYMINDDLRKIRYVEQSGSAGFNIQFGNSRRLAIDPTTTPSAQQILGSGNSFQIPIKDDFVNVDTNTYEHLLIIFPKGFKFITPSAYYTDKKVPNIHALYAENMNWASFLIEEPYPGSFPVDASATPSYVELLGIYAPEIADSYTITYKSAVGFESALLACTGSSTDTITVEESDFMTVLVYPSEVVSQGPDSSSVDLGIKVRTTTKVPTGGRLEIDLNGSQWEMANGLTFCEVSGVNGVCSAGSGKIIVDQFSDLPVYSIFTVYIYSLIPPTYTQTSVNLINSITTYNSLNQALNSFEGNASQIDDINLKESKAQIAQPTDKVVKIFPNSSKYSPADLYVSFSMIYDLGINSVIQLELTETLWKSIGDIKENCWVEGIEYNSCQVLSASLLQIKLRKRYYSGTLIEIYISAQVTVGKDTVDTSSLKISAKFSTIFAIQDTQPTKIQPIPEVIAGASVVLDISVLTYGQTANYTFQAQFVDDLAGGEQVYVEFPSKFDLLLGDVTILDSSIPQKHYIDCSGSAILNNFCSVSLRTVYFTISKAVTAEQKLNFTLYNIKNPSSTDSSLSLHAFKLYVKSKSGDILQMSDQIPDIIFSGTPSIINIPSITSSSNGLQELADYTFELYLPSSTTASSVLQIAFPVQYNPVDSYDCEVLVTNMTVEQPQEESWISGKCEVQRNVLSLELTEKEFGQNVKVKVVVKGIRNPEWGRTRLQLGSEDFEVIDTEFYPEKLYWTSPLQVSVVDITEKQVVAQSNPNYNRLSLGFNQNKILITVNEFDPATEENAILIYPGTRINDVKIAIPSPCIADELKFTYEIISFFPSETPVDYIKIDTPENIVIVKEEIETSFTLLADVQTQPGFYYIYWKIAEVPQVNVYVPPPRTLIIVKSQTEPFSIKIPNLPAITIGKTSSPIRVRLEHSPSSSLEINIEVAARANSELIAVDPSIIIFNPGETDKYFTITVQSKYIVEDGMQQELLMTLAGNNSSQYSITSVHPFQARVSPSAPGRITYYSFFEITNTKARFQVYSSVPGAVYLYIAQGDGVAPTFETISSLFGDLLQNSSNKVVYEPETDPMNTDETKFNYEYRLYRNHFQRYVIFGGTIEEDLKSDAFTLDNLWAETTYMITGYLVIEDVISSTFVHKFETGDMMLPTNIEVYFTESVSEAYANSLLPVFSDVMKLHQDQIEYQEKIIKESTNPNRRLQTLYGLRYLIWVPRNWKGISPYSLSDAVVKDLDGFKTAAIDINFGAEINSVQAAEITQGLIPKWTSFPDYESLEGSVIKVKSAISEPGSIICIRDTSGVPTPTNMQVYMNLGYDNKEVSSMVMIVEDPNKLVEIEFRGLAPGAEYSIFCTAANDDPHWPIIMSESLDAPSSQVILVETTQDFEDFSETLLLWALLLLCL